MQTIGFIKDKDNRKILVLAQQAKFCRYFKIRKSGRNGVHFADEELFLKSNPSELDNLKKGITLAL
jgi:hypothetical protein